MASAVRRSISSQNQNNFLASNDRELRDFPREQCERPITINIVFPFDLTNEQRISRVAFSHDINLVRPAVEPSAPPPSRGTPLNASVARTRHAGSREILPDSRYVM